jgi:hypothetical protein
MSPAKDIRQMQRRCKGEQKSDHGLLVNLSFETPVSHDETHPPIVCHVPCSPFSLSSGEYILIIGATNRLSVSTIEPTVRSISKVRPCRRYQTKQIPPHEHCRKPNSARPTECSSGGLKSNKSLGQLPDTESLLVYTSEGFPHPEHFRGSGRTI